ncbi:MAG: response regulator [Cyanobacteria bacterium CRU_2_1]|nr:response regulator [Cyanobacteria bacterium CRU_2_1]
MQVSSRCDRLSPKILPDHQPSNLRILLVEDNPTNQKLTLKQLQSLGHTADIVGNGYAAVTTIAHSRYDLVLMDCHLPLIDGFTATLAIRDRESQNTAPCSKRIIVIAMTASDSRQDRERAIAVGMDDYLLKPVRRETLATLLNHWSQIIAAADLPASDAPPVFPQS